VLAFSTLKRLTALMLLLSVAFLAHAQSRNNPSIPPETMDFSGVRYNLTGQQSQADAYGAWYYQPELQEKDQSRHQELILSWRAHEYISDTKTGKECPQLAGYLAYPRTDIAENVVYNACEEILSLQGDGAKNFYVKVNVDEGGEIIIISLVMGNEVGRGEFAKLSISRYMPVVIPNVDWNENSVFLYAYAITSYDYDDEMKALFQEMIDQKDDPRMLRGVLEGAPVTQPLLELPVPQFIIDRANYYAPYSRKN